MSTRRPSAALAILRAAATTGELERFCARWDVDLLVAFGSTVDPERAEDARDLDLAVLFAEPPPGLGHLSFVTELTGWLQLDELDVVDLGRAGPVLREQALAYGVPLYERTPSLFAERQIQAITARMDTAWLRRRQLDFLSQRT